MKGLLIKLLTIASLALPIACSHNHGHDNRRHGLESQLLSMINNAPGTVGIAFVSDSDTIVINNGVHYGMMSVFKLHQALAVCHELENRDASVDSVIHVSADEIDPDTWSPMLKEYGNSSDFDISIRSLINHAVITSDNNASNIMFSRIVSPELTDRYIRSIAPDTAFAIEYTEADMKRDNSLLYSNYSSPLAAALLIHKLFTTDDLLTPQHRDIVRDALCRVTTGHNRIAGALQNLSGATFAHKTGSGYRHDRGELTAFNDVAYIRLPDGRDYSLAIMIRDYADTDSSASALMSQISHTILRSMTQQ